MSEFLSPFNFEVHLTESGLGGDDAIARSAAFSEVTGLEITLESKELREGGYNSGVRRLAGKASHATLVLKRGVTLDAGFWEWIQACVSGEFPLPYLSGSILMFPPSIDRDDADPVTWTFRNGLCTKVKSADLRATSASEVPLEEVHIEHEGLAREAS